MFDTCMSSFHNRLHFNELNSIMNKIHKLSLMSLCICDVSSDICIPNKLQVSRKQSEQTEIFKISSNIISKVLKNEMVKRIEVSCISEIDHYRP